MGSKLVEHRAKEVLQDGEIEKMVVDLSWKQAMYWLRWWKEGRQ